MAVILGIVAGLALGAIAIWLLPGVPGIIVGMVVAALGYIGVSSLLTPERRLGGIAASLLPNGEAASQALDEAAQLSKRLRKLADRMREPDVKSAALALLEAIGKLSAYVESDPSSYRRLAHFLNTYGDQCENAMSGWLSLEATGDERHIAEAKDDQVIALRGLTAAAKGSLGQVADAHASQIEASQEAIRRLLALDGYDVDGAPAPDQAPSQEGNSDEHRQG